MARGRHPTRIYVDPPDELTAEKYLFQWNSRDLQNEPHRFPRLTSKELFGNDLPLEIDFGCGNGNLACSRAERRTDRNILGIDQSQKPIFCGIRDAAALGLDNVAFARGDFNVMLPLLQQGTITTVFYLFPNPPRDYFRERANAKRSRFLHFIHNALVPQGRFYFASDAPSFFDCMLGIVKSEPDFRLIDSTIDDDYIMTMYRLKWEEQGKMVRSFVIEK